MNCAEVRGLLPLVASGDLDSERRAAVTGHLASCPACRRELTAIQEIGHILDSVPGPSIRMDVGMLYRKAAEAQHRRLRRWRAAACILGAVAALLLVVFGLRLEVRVEAHQLVLRWGEVPETVQPPLGPVPAPIVNVPPPAVPETNEARVQLLGDLVRALASDVETRDYDRQQELARLRAEVEALRRQALQRWTATERDVAALYAAQFLLTKGKGP
jgi:anti-sigma factor RsiW